ncbi:hypothetical protein B566_EDAN014323 [Ephemera danica]|nr:hypothetical protein B566_EDAN014323 [Ephemera danica]
MPSLQDEVDARSYYSEDQGLAVILEEPEEEEERSSSSAASSDCSPWPATASSSNESGVAGEEEQAAVPADVEQDRVLDAYKETVRQRFARTKLADVVFTAPSACADAAEQSAEAADERDANGSPLMADAVSGMPRSNGHAAAAADDAGDYVEPIFTQFSHVNTDEEIRKPRPTTRSWDPSMLLRALYSLPDTFKSSSPPAQCCVTIEGYLEKLPSGKKKATFWNAWKRRYFRAKDGCLYYYQNNQCEKPSMTMQLMGGKVDSLESSILGVEDRQPMVSTMLGIDDGKGHYVVVRCANKQETERWRLALMTHIAENFSSTYVHPWPIPKDPALIKDTIIIDLGSSSIRAGILCTQPSLPQLFFPTIMAIDKISKKRTYGGEALRPDVRATSTLHYPVRPSAKITKYSVDLTAVVGFLQKIFQDLNVDQKLYDVILSVPRSFNASTQTELLNILFDQFGVGAVNMTHQSVLALYAYNATSGIVVDIGERMDIVPISDGYIVENGVSRIPYGGTQIVDHLRHFLMQKQYSLVTEVESFLIRYVLENMCYCAPQYNSELNKCRQDPASVEDSISIKKFFDDPHSHMETITLDSGRFQPTEGLFSPEAWGLDNPGVHKMVHRAIQVHTSPYRYHAAFLGACVLANSPGVDQMKITFQEWSQAGCSALKKWTL